MMRTERSSRTAFSRPAWPTYAGGPVTTPTGPSPKRAPSGCRTGRRAAAPTASTSPPAPCSPMSSAGSTTAVPCPAVGRSARTAGASPSRRASYRPTHSSRWTTSPTSRTGPSAPSARPASRRGSTALAEWNDTHADRVRPTIVEMFHEQARTRPDAIAIVDEHRSLTYREAAELSGELAHHLLDRGLRRRTGRRHLPRPLRRDGDRAARRAPGGGRVRTARSAVARRAPRRRHRRRPGRDAAQRLGRTRPGRTGSRGRRPRRLAASAAAPPRAPGSPSPAAPWRT